MVKLSVDPLILNLNGRIYRIQRFDGDPPLWRLHGSRGAIYDLLRNRNDPSLLFLISANPRNSYGTLKIDPLGPITLTDRNGYLEQYLQ